MKLRNWMFLKGQKCVNVDLDCKIYNKLRLYVSLFEIEVLWLRLLVRFLTGQATEQAYVAKYSNAKIKLLLSETWFSCCFGNATTQSNVTLAVEPWAPGVNIYVILWPQLPACSCTHAAEAFMQTIPLEMEHTADSRLYLVCSCSEHIHIDLAEFPGLFSLALS